MPMFDQVGVPAEGVSAIPRRGGRAWRSQSTRRCSPFTLLLPLSTPRAGNVLLLLWLGAAVSCCLAAPITRGPDAFFSSAATAIYGDISGSTAAGAVSQALYRVGAAWDTVISPALISRARVGVLSTEEAKAYASVSSPGRAPLEPRQLRNEASVLVAAVQPEPLLLVGANTPFACCSTVRADTTAWASECSRTSPTIGPPASSRRSSPRW